MSQFERTSYKDLRDVLRKRQSIRYYLPTPIPEKLIEDIIENAACAPSAHNRQPWRFYIINNDTQKKNLAMQMGEKLKADRLKDNDPIEIIKLDMARSYKRITEAPSIIVAFLTLSEMDTYPDEKRNHFEYLMAVQSTAMAVQNLLLSAHAAGIGACWMCAPLFCPEILINVLQTPADWQPQAMITLGYPAAPTKLKPRKSINEIIWQENI